MAQICIVSSLGKVKTQIVTKICNEGYGSGCLSSAVTDVNFTL